MKTLWILIFCLSVLPLYGGVWEDQGFAIEKVQANEEGKNKILVKDKEGKSFSVTYSEEANDNQAEMIVRFKKELDKWEKFTVQDLQFFITGKRIDVVVVPSEFSLDGADIAVLVPSGLVFYIEQDVTKYDFRILKDYLPIKIRGIYMNQLEIKEKITKAFNNPYAFIQMNEPDYYLAKVDEAEKEIVLLKKEIESLKYLILYTLKDSLVTENSEQNKKAIQRIISIKKSNPGFNAKEIDEIIRKEGFKLSKKEVQLILAVYLYVYED